MRPLARALRLAALALLAACGGSEPEPSVSLAPGWNAIQGMVCADGSPTGIGVSPGTRNRVLVVLSGGGACWSETACNASLRSFGSIELSIAFASTANTILDRSLPGNPFFDWTFVFVPYCTGDVHAGADVTRSYGTKGTWRHHGRANLDAALARVAAAMPSPEKLVVAGSSAGGFGALLAFDIARARWPAGPSGPKAYLVDDSGQTFVGDDLPQGLRDAWWASWNLDATVTPLCATCKTDLSQLWNVLRAAHPADRLALLTTTQDTTMMAFFGITDAAQFQTGVTNLAAKVSLISGAHAFVVGDPTHLHGHALLLDPGAYSAGGTSLAAWLGLQVNDDPGWTSAGP
jgi:Pectinacetylesterase